MMFHIQKSYDGVFDTDLERQRIEAAFSKNPFVKKRLNELMDLIEAQDWRSAEKLLDSRWWNGHDEHKECPRVEFIGSMDIRDPKNHERLADGFDHCHTSYEDLVYMMIHRPNNYKLTKVEGKTK